MIFFARGVVTDYRAWSWFGDVCLVCGSIPEAEASQVIGGRSKLLEGVAKVLVLGSATESVGILRRVKLSRSVKKQTAHELQQKEIGFAYS